VYERSGCCTEGSEVYSFGMVMLEVLTGLAPSATDQTVPGGISFPIAEKVAPQQPGALERMRGGDSTAEWPRALFKELATMALRCVDASERLRPHFVELVRFLKSLAERFPKTEFAPAVSTMAMPAIPMQVMSSRAPATPMSGRIATRHIEPRLCQSERKPLVEDSCEGRHFVLELQESAACKIEALSSEWRWLPLVPSEGNCAVVGRHLQQALFEAWLPCPQHACISRRAIEIYWDPNGEAKLVSCGSNPVLVDGVQVEKGAAAPTRLLPGSEICFAYDGKVLLRLRYLAFESCSFTPQWSLECSRRLAADDLERWRIPMLPGVSSVTEAVDRLNSGKAKCSDGLCIVFCPADCQYFLLYRKGCKAAALAAREAGTAVPRRSLAWTPPEEAFCELRCLQAEGMTRAELQALPLEHREMPVPLGYSFIKTEVLLREPSNDPQSLHGLLQLHAEPKVLSLTMLQRRAGIAVYIDEEELVPGFARRLQQGQVLIVVKQDGSTQRTVLVLQVHWFYEPDKVSSTAGPVTTRQTRGTDRSVPTLNSEQKSLQSTTEIQRFRSEPGGVLPPPRCRAKQGPESELEAPAVFLEISGSSAKDLPVAQRRLGPMTLRNQPWIIGRRHQKEFLQRTVKDESLEFISRDHFAIAYREGSFLLLALSQNRIWVDRGKVGIRSLQQDEMMPLRPGDRILLGTAPDDATSTRDSKARLDWLFQVQEQNGRATSMIE